MNFKIFGVTMVALGLMAGGMAHAADPPSGATFDRDDGSAMHILTSKPGCIEINKGQMASINQLIDRTGSPPGVLIEGPLASTDVLDPEGDMTPSGQDIAKTTATNGAGITIAQHDQSLGVDIPSLAARDAGETAAASFWESGAVVAIGLGEKKTINEITGAEATV